MDLKRFRHATTLAEMRSFAKAAHALHITQPALTRSIQTLESELGVQLFDRQRSGVIATDAGQLVLRHARQLILARQDLDHELKVALNLESGSLSIGVGPYGAALLVGSAVAAMCRTYPQIQLDLHINPWQDLPRMLRTREVEAVISDVREVEKLDDVQVIQLNRHPIYAVCRSGHPVLQTTAPTFKQVMAFPQAGPSMPAHFLEKNARTTRPFDIVCDSSSVIKTLLLQSDAIGFMAPFMVKDEIARGELQLLKSVKAKPIYRFGITCLKGRSPSRALLKFIELVKTHDTAWRENASSAQSLNRDTTPP